MDHETVYRLTYDRQWPALLDVVHRNRTAAVEDPLLAQAVSTFLDAFFAELEASAEAAPYAAVLEKLFLLHTGRIYPLSEDRFEQVVVRLVNLHAGDPEAARGYARHRPAHPRCAGVLADHAAPPALDHAQDETISLRARPPGDEDATTPLFKSAQEVDFFLAVREVFATYFVYPNVALSCLVDYERLRPHLSGEDRSYFFRALVDCVVFDQHDGYRPRFFFELDSPLHDDEVRQARDRSKERILALAGQTLYRIRPHAPSPGRAAFVRLLKEIAEKARA